MVVILHKFRTVKELQSLQMLACSLPDEVWVRNSGRAQVVDAKSIINLFTLDFSRSVEIVTEAEEIAALLEHWEVARTEALA